jgi:serine protease AprX
MRIERDWLRELVFETAEARRFTQDSPILPEVWLSGGVAYCRAPYTRVDLLLTPHRLHTAADLARVLLRGLEISFVADDAEKAPPHLGPLGPSEDAPLARPTWTVSVNQTTVACSLTLVELVTCALPLSQWWKRNIDPPDKTKKASERKADRARQRDEILWMSRLVGVIALCAQEPTRLRDVAPDPNALWVSSRIDRQTERATIGEYQRFREIVADRTAQERIFQRLIAEAKRTAAKRRGAVRERPKAPPYLWSTGLNRQSFVAIDRSVAATKADAARRVFNIKCDDLAWAIVDSGIDAEHAAFQLKEPDPVTGLKTRVRATYDFTRLRPLLSLDSHPTTGPSSMPEGVNLEDADRQFKRMRQRLRSGRSLDWTQLEPLVDISLRKEGGGAYRPPDHDHGTHVAGILAAADAQNPTYQGMCPDIALYDLRVLDAGGQGEEFGIIAALQFIRYLNARADQPVIHGVNLSLSIIHDVENFACGRTPICDECERLVASGVVVVAAAGNRGYERVVTAAGELDAYRAISITDPGNTDAAITVGATHRFEPHTYGVSYFSSRGPTGDGRRKPDVLAPGERINSSLPRGFYGVKDGTSMAAPHVSGVAALLMARHREFVGQPARVKKIICDTATDLGREHYFQGFGMVDALRALQSV